MRSQDFPPNNPGCVKGVQRCQGAKVAGHSTPKQPLGNPSCAGRSRDADSFHRSVHKNIYPRDASTFSEGNWTLHNSVSKHLLRR